MYYVYIIRSKVNDKIYIGSTNNLKRRVFEHNRGYERSTKSFRPWILFYYEAYGDEKLSRLREKRLKNNGNALKELKKRIGLAKAKSGAGFTLIELLISLAIITAVAGLAVPFLFSYQASSDVLTYTDQVERTLRRAQWQAVSGQNGDSWGVYFDNGQKQFVLFKGIDFDNRDQDYDQFIEYPPGLNLSSTFGDEINFQVYLGVPSANGTITATTTESDFFKTINVDSLGIINVVD